MKLHVCAPDIFAGDAVGNHCLGVARMAERLGWDVEVYARQFDVSTRTIHDINALFTNVHADDLLLLSYSIFDPNLDALLGLPCRKVCYFHGITSPDLLRAFEPQTAILCEQALAQLPQLAGFDTVIANSRFSANSLPPAVNVTSVIVIPPVFADMPALVDTRPPTRRSGTGLNLLMVGRVVPHKRIEDAIDVLAQLAERNIDVSLSVVGSMPNFEYTKFLLNRARAAGVLGRIDFTGMIDDVDVSAAFDEASALLSLSRHEGFCVPALEAMVRGLPAFVRDGHAAAEVVATRELIFAVDADAAQIAAGIEDILTSSHRLAEIKSRVQLRARELLQQSGEQSWLRAFNQQATR